MAADNSPMTTTTFIVSNLHCPSCVSNIESAVSHLKPKPRLRSSSIINHTLIFEHKQPVAEIETLLEDQGYEVDSTISHTSDDRTLRTQSSRTDSALNITSERAAKHRENCQQCRDEAESRPSSPFVIHERPGVLGQFQYALSIEGMTCASCVGTITKALDKIPWIVSANVNLLSGSATILTEGDTHRDELLETIEDLGYDVKVEVVTSMEKKDSASDLSQGDKNSTKPSGPARRTVELLIEGMYCHHCPSRIEKALQTLPQDVKIQSPPTLQQPILKLTYTPNAHDFTIRRIIETIAEADDAFTPTIYHPPTVEERAEKMHRRERQRLLYRLIFAGVVAIPTFIVGIVYMTLLPANDPGRMYLMSPLQRVSRAEWALLILATPVYFGCADIFHRRAWKEIRTLWHPRSKVPILRRFYRFGSMSMLLSFGTTIAYFASIAQVAVEASKADMRQEGNFTYFDSVVFLTFFLLIGRLIEAYSKAKSGDAVAALGRLRPKETMLITNQEDIKVSTELLDVGDRVRIPHGGSPPCDGILLSEKGIMDESSLTGESAPVKKVEGDAIYSGTINQGDAFVMRVTGTAGSSMLDQIIAAVRDGQTKRAPVERVVDSLTAYFVPFVTLVAVATWLIWLGLGLGHVIPEDWKDSSNNWAYWSLQFAIAVFVIACPCGIGLAAPTALFVGGGLAAKHGILVKGGGEAFQEASQLDCIVFDKTGTVTQGGQPEVTDFEFTSIEIRKEDLLALMSAVENTSSHPIAKAISHFCAQKGTPIELKETQEISGKGMLGIGPTHSILIGNERLMTDNDVVLTSTQASLLTTWSTQAKSVVLIATRPTSSFSAAYTLAAQLSISDPLRPESAPVIAALQRMKIAVYLLTGDNPTTAAAVGRALHLPDTNVISGVLPAEKAAKIRSLQATLTPSRGRARATVAMVGDGINDSPALTAADVGVAMGADQAADVAIAAAGFVLVRADLNGVLTLLRLSRVVFRRIRFNFFWALVYNLVALPVAAGALYPLRSGAGGGHVRLDPAWAALAMALSSVSVVGSSLLLRSGIPGLGFRG